MWTSRFVRSVFCRNQTWVDVPLLARHICETFHIGLVPVGPTLICFEECWPQLRFYKECICTNKRCSQNDRGVSSVTLLPAQDLHLSDTSFRGAAHPHNQTYFIEFLCGQPLPSSRAGHIYIQQAMLSTINACIG